MTPLVLGYVEDYTADDLRPFFDSLRATGYSGGITLFVRNLSAATLAYLRSRGVECIPTRRVDMKHAYTLPDWAQRLTGVPAFRPDLTINRRIAQGMQAAGMADTSAGQRVARALWHCNVARFYYYQNYLERHPEYDVVLVADIRDIVFQADPFAVPEAADRLLLFEEHGSKPVAVQGNNAYWIQAMYGASTLELIGHHPVICAGVMLGGYTPMLDTIRVMNADMIDHYIGWGTDQGVLNQLARTERIAPVDVFPYGSGPAMHIGIAPRDSIRLDGQGRILNQKGEVCAIIHQYDRHPDLESALLGSTSSVAALSSAA